MMVGGWVGYRSQSERRSALNVNVSAPCQTLPLLRKNQGDILVVPLGPNIGCSAAAFKARPLNREEWESL